MKYGLYSPTNSIRVLIIFIYSASLWNYKLRKNLQEIKINLDIVLHNCLNTSFVMLILKYNKLKYWSKVYCST